MFKNFGKYLLSGVAGSLVIASPAAAQDDGSVEYTFKAGDTLYDLAQKYFRSESAALQVQRLNGIRNARGIPVGEVIEVPRSLLKWEPVSLQVAFFKGNVCLEQGSGCTAPVSGQQLRRNTIVTTGPRSFVSIKGEGRTAVSLPSNSSVLIKRARRYTINNALDVDLRVLKGRGEISAPRLRDQERFRTGTPLAVTAVRGTDFRVAYDEASGTALTEVTKGLVDISIDGASTAAAAGQGVASDASGLGQPEQLLEAPNIADRNGIQTGELVEFSITPVSGAVAYRTQIAKDQTFTDVIDEQVSSDVNVTFAEVDDARLAVRARAIAGNGLEGFWQEGDPSFKRKRVGGAASVEPAPFADAYQFAWLPLGKGPSYTAFQMWRKDAPETLVIDEVGLDAGGFYVSDLPNGAYLWRTGTSVIDEGEVIKIWNEPQPLNVSE